MTSDAMITDEMVEAGAEVAYLRNREGSIAWADISAQHKSEWREKVRPVITAANAAAWRTMESAPRDGTEVILSDETGWVGSGFWNDGATCRRGEAGWFFEDDRQNLIIARNCCPTHWMPLPAPPQQEGV